MSNASSHGTPDDTPHPDRVRGKRRRVPVTLIVALALVGAGLVAEREPAPVASESAGHRSTFFTSSSSGGLSKAFRRVSTSSTPRTRPGFSRAGSGGAQNSNAAVLAQAQRIADQGVADSRAAAVRAQQDESPECGFIQQVRARVISLIRSLINGFPNLAPQLNGILNRSLALINSFLAQQGCPPAEPPSG